MVADAGNAAPCGSAGPGTAPSIRVDKWLWFTRIVKSRSLATTLVTGGKVRINKVRAAKASQTVRTGDVVTVTAHRRVHVLKVLAIGTRRGPAPEAQALYEDLSPQPTSSHAGPKAAVRDNPTPGDDGLAPEPSAPAQREAGAGRPTKRDRRAMDRMRARSDNG